MRLLVLLLGFLEYSRFAGAMTLIVFDVLFVRRPVIAMVRSSSSKITRTSDKNSRLQSSVNHWIAVVGVRH